MYTNLNSEFIKTRLHGLAWEKRGYVNDLISLRAYILNPPTEYVSNMHFANLKHQYQDEYLVILKEVSVELYEKEIRAQDEIRKIKERSTLLEAEKEKNLKEDWLKGGGIE